MGLRSSRLVLACTAGAAMLLSAGAASAADFPKGTFTVEHEGTKWSLRFGDEGKFILSRDDEEVVEGTYKAEKDEVEFTDVKGQLANPGGKAGTYSWTLKDKSLTFVKVEDDSQGRTRALTTHPWTRKD